MQIGVLGTGMVGRTIATKLVELGHEVTMGSRDSAGEAVTEWAAENGDGASAGSFAEAAAAGEVVFNCTAGTASLSALDAAGAESLAGKVLVDVANPLDFSRGMPPRLSVCNDDSLAEQIQRAFPEARVVKALNTVNASVMVDPGTLREPTDIPICGEDASAKEVVAQLLESFGWPGEHVLDLGPITAARGMEMYLPFWLALMGAVGGPGFNLRIVRAG
jgi:8-hydroxy-5-deazaflavin:NADPH oxidoreductase